MLYLFNNIYKEKFIYSCSMIGVSQNKIIDLLECDINNQELRIGKSNNDKIIIDNLTEIIINKIEDFYLLIKRGLKQQNNNKITCDLIFQVKIQSLIINTKGNLLDASINFCDLKYDYSNKNYLSANSVLTCLSNNVKTLYKDSNLTKFLSGTLNKSSNTLIIAHIIIDEAKINNTLEVLELANSAKNIQISPIINEQSFNNFYMFKKLFNDIYK